jgi:dCTP deaminase
MVPATARSEEIAAGRLVFDPYDESLVQPSSVDMRVDRSFRVFNNSRYRTSTYASPWRT